MEKAYKILTTFLCVVMVFVTGIFVYANELKREKEEKPSISVQTILTNNEIEVQEDYSIVVNGVQIELSNSPRFFFGNGVVIPDYEMEDSNFVNKESMDIIAKELEKYSSSVLENITAIYFVNNMYDTHDEKISNIEGLTVKIDHANESLDSESGVNYIDCYKGYVIYVEIIDEEFNIRWDLEDVLKTLNHEISHVMTYMISSRANSLFTAMDRINSEYGDEAYARPYGKTNPHEDVATIWELYTSDTALNEAQFAKVELINSYFSNLMN